MSPPATRPFYGQKLQRPGPRPRRRWGHRAVLRGWRERWHGGRLWSASLGRAAGCGGAFQQLEAKGELKCAEGQGLPAAFRLLRRPDPRRAGERRPDRSERDEGAQLPAVDECGWTGSSVTCLVRPKSLLVMCGDGNGGLVRLRWASWGRQEASARDTYTWNTCVLECAAPASKWDDTATLSEPLPTPQGPLFCLLSVHVVSRPVAALRARPSFMSRQASRATAPTGAGPGKRRVSSFMRQLLHRNTVSAGSSSGLLIHATVGKAGGVGGLRTKRSGWAA